jgi:hypothetical protein
VCNWRSDPRSNSARRRSSGSRWSTVSVSLFAEEMVTEASKGELRRG